MTLLHPCSMSASLPVGRSAGTCTSSLILPRALYTACDSTAVQGTSYCCESTYHSLMATEPAHDAAARCHSTTSIPHMAPSSDSQLDSMVSALSPDPALSTMTNGISLHMPMLCEPSHPLVLSLVHTPLLMLCMPLPMLHCFHSVNHWWSLSHAPHARNPTYDPAFTYVHFSHVHGMQCFSTSAAGIPSSCSRSSLTMCIAS